MTPVPVAVPRFGRKAVKVGVTTLKTTAPIGVFSMSFSCCSQCSEPGAVPGHSLTVWAWPERTATRIPNSNGPIERSMGSIG
jgi:hypothetical protein